MNSNMEIKKLVVNAAICDARNVLEATLKAYESIAINAATILISKETKELLSRYNVSMNTSEVMELPLEAEIMVENGTFEVSERTLMSKPTVLIVNGTLDIQKNSKAALDMFLSIIVNGLVTYPSDLKDQLPPMKVNGTTECYPGDAIRLNNKLLLDRVFILKAKGSKYYVRNKVVITDSALDLTKLIENGVTFITKKALVVESQLEDAISLFDENVEIKVIPDGYAYVTEKKLDETLIQRYGDKLYIDNDFIITSDSAQALDRLIGVKVNGTVLIVQKLMEKFHSIAADYQKLRTIKGKIIEDKGTLTIDKQMVVNQEDGITVSDCGMVYLQEDITVQDIEERLQFIDIGCICCYPNQRGAVEFVAEDVGYIESNQVKNSNSQGDSLEDKLFNNDTKVVNAVSYKM